jgi:hypothetical protein
MSKSSQPIPPRIGSGFGYFAGGWSAILLGLFVGFASSASMDRAAGSVIASALVAAGVGMIAIGFWVKLFGLVERRLFEIERRLAPEPPEAPQVKPAEPSADPFLG